MKKHIKILNYKTNTLTENTLNTNFLDNNKKTNPNVSGKDVVIGIRFTLLHETTRKLDKIYETSCGSWTSGGTEIRKTGEMSQDITQPSSRRQLLGTSA